MNWFRSNIRHGSRLALLALALQFGLSFGHFHGVAAQAAPAIQAAAAQSDISAAPAASDIIDRSAQRPASHNETDPHPGNVCAICAVMALGNSVLFAPPPLLPLPQAIELSYLATAAKFVQLDSAHGAFQPRAPPAS